MQCNWDLFQNVFAKTKPNIGGLLGSLIVLKRLLSEFLRILYTQGEIDNLIYMG